MLMPEQIDGIFMARKRQIQEERGMKVCLVVITGTALAALGKFV